MWSELGRSDDPSKKNLGSGLPNISPEVNELVSKLFKTVFRSKKSFLNSENELTEVLSKMQIYEFLLQSTQEILGFETRQPLTSSVLTVKSSIFSFCLQLQPTCSPCSEKIFGIGQKFWKAWRLIPSFPEEMLGCPLLIIPQNTPQMK